MKLRPLALALASCTLALPPASAQATAPGGVRAQVRALADSGKLDDAERLARAGGMATSSALGEILVTRGRLAEADSTLRIAAQRDAAGRRTAEAILGELALRRGDRPEAVRWATGLTTAYEARPASWSAEERVAAGRAYVILGARSPADVRSALAAFDKAVAADSLNLEGRLRAGDLFFDKFNSPDAKSSYEGVLRIVPANARALLGMARVAEFDGKGDPLPLLERSLASNPALADARVFLARTQLEAEAYDSATAEARRAIAIDRSSIPAWAVLAASAWLTGDSATYREAKTAAERLNPRPADFYLQIASAAIRQRRYEDGVRLASLALSMDSTSVHALGVVGTNELRAGEIAAGRTHLEKAFALDPFNLVNKNTLDLLDELAKFTTVERGHFRIVAPSAEAELLAMYILPLLEQEYDALSRRYGYQPPTKIRLELYDAKADFSVRAVGLAGLGALGVSFGPVLAMDAPSATKIGEFNWGSVAWHEVAHTFTLGLSRSRAPRWLSEGLSVLEERRAKPEWGAKATVDFLAAYKGGRVRAVSQLNDGFIHPRYDLEVIYSYYDASLVCEMIEESHGAKAIVDMLTAYRDGSDTPTVFAKVLGVKLHDFDKQFDAWVRARFAVPFQSIDARDGKGDLSGPFVAAMRRAADLIGRKETDSARAELLRAQEMFPGYGGSQSPAELLANLAFERHDFLDAIRQVRVVTTSNESAWLANRMEASALQRIGDSTGALVPLQRMLWISPYDVSVHAEIAAIATKNRVFATAVRERRAIVLLRPSDILTARYELARALVDVGDVAGARKELLAVLEQAPSFEKAQALLLEIRGRSGAP